VRHVGNVSVYLFHSFTFMWSRVCVYIYIYIYILKIFSLSSLLKCVRNIQCTKSYIISLLSGQHVLHYKNFIFWYKINWLLHVIYFDLDSVGVLCAQFCLIVFAQNDQMSFEQEHTENLSLFLSCLTWGRLLCVVILFYDISWFHECIIA
jgi:hypothetical protein